MSLEVHVGTRVDLRPDPRFDSVSAVFYSIYNDARTFEHVTTGIITVHNSSSSSLYSPQQVTDSLRNCLSHAEDTCVNCVNDERLLFEKLAEVVWGHDPDIMLGYEIQMASWGYLIERASVLKIDLLAMLSRVLTKKEHRNTNKFPEDYTVTDQTADTDRLNIPGRIVLNVWRIMRKEVTLNTYSFENVYYHVLHRRIPHYEHKDLTRWFNGKEKEITVCYYITRVLGPIRMLEKLDVIRRTSELARLFGIQFYEVLSRGSQFRVESMMLRTAGPSFVPVSPSTRQRARSRAAESVPLILEPESRFYTDPVVVLDFQSLYPSMIIAYNYCFSTCLGRVDNLGKLDSFDFGCASLNVRPSHLRRLLLKEKVHISPASVAFVRASVRRGVLPQMLEEILNTRILVKQAMKKTKDGSALKKLLDARQVGLKLIANVTYGYTGASFSGRMPCVEVADSVVSKGRETLERAILTIHSTPKWNAQVVYGDTDSLFLLMRDRTKEEAFKIGQEIADVITAQNPPPVKLKFEKVYLPCVLQTKKRYVGYMYETLDQKEPVYDAKGIETVRRDSCPATAKILEKSLKILFRTYDLHSVEEYVKKQFGKILKGRVNLTEFTFAKEYRGMAGYRSGACVPALEIAKKRLSKDPRSEPRVSERVPYVVVHGFPGLPIIRLVREPADLLADSSLRLNSTYYITRVISPPLERVFALIMGANVKAWYTSVVRCTKLALPDLNPTSHARETITQYFASRNCPVCEEVTNARVCASCLAQPTASLLSLHTQIRQWERASCHLSKICTSCTKYQSGSAVCSSIDCPQLFKLNLAMKDLSQAQYLRNILSDMF